jgi:hypothetical protein
MNEQSSSGEIIAGHEVTRLRSGYVVRSLDGLREVGVFSRRVQAEQAAHLAAAFAAVEQERLADAVAANG